MSRDVRLHPHAAAELVEAQEWYEQQRGGLGDRFIAASGAALKRISRWPSAGTPVVMDDDGAVINRKTPIGGFPWAVGAAVRHRPRRMEDHVLLLGPASDRAADGVPQATTEGAP